MQKYLVHGVFKAKSGSGEELAKVMMEAGDLAKTLNGCILYAIGKKEADPDCIYVSELWEKKEDHENCILHPTMRSIVMEIQSIIDGHPKKEFDMDVFAGFGF